MVKLKDPKRQLLGRIAKAKGKQFEERLDMAFSYYKQKGIAVIEKTPEPMHPVKNIGHGKFIAYYEKQAQPDYKGTIQGGRTVLLEAKFTDSERIEQNRVKRNQAEYMDRHCLMDALCYIVVGFASGSVYKIPWTVWKDMKEIYGRMYVREDELEKYRVQTARNGTLLLLE